MSSPEDNFGFFNISDHLPFQCSTPHGNNTTLSPRVTTSTHPSPATPGLDSTPTTSAYVKSPFLDHYCSCHLDVSRCTFTVKSLIQDTAERTDVRDYTYVNSLTEVRPVEIQKWTSMMYLATAFLFPSYAPYY